MQPVLFGMGAYVHIWPLQAPSICIYIIYVGLNACACQNRKRKDTPLVVLLIGSTYFLFFGLAYLLVIKPYLYLKLSSHNTIQVIMVSSFLSHKQNIQQCFLHPNHPSVFFPFCLPHIFPLKMTHG
jgi:hypothetical protein